MKNGIVTALAIVLASGTGCASKGWRSEQIPYPRTTPFDRDQFARTAFLDGFESGYRAEIAGGPTSVEALSGPYLSVRRQGFYLGMAEARSRRAPDADRRIR